LGQRSRQEVIFVFHHRKPSIVSMAVIWQFAHSGLMMALVKELAVAGFLLTKWTHGVIFNHHF